MEPFAWSLGVDVSGWQLLASQLRGSNLALDLGLRVWDLGFRV